MKKSLMLLAAPALALMAACGGKTAEQGPAVQVSWDVETLQPDSAGHPQYLQTYVVKGDLSRVKRLCFNQFKRPMTLDNSEDTLIELLPGYYAIASPRFEQAVAGDSVVIKILTDGRLGAICYGPDGVHTVLADGSTQPVALTLATLSDDASKYTTPAEDRTPYGDAVYAFNETLAGGTKGVYDVVPSFKSVEVTGGKSIVNPAEATFEPIDATAHEGEYTIEVKDGKMTVRAPQKQWSQLRARIAHFFGSEPVEMPNAVITDYPSYGYRGMMIDIARNYQTPEEMKRVLDLMAVYGLNTLQFHAIDDEAWRVEIDGFPELTEIGGRRGYIPEGQTADYLPQIYRGDGTTTAKNTANGYFTRQQYIDMVRYADSLGIKVIPEIESPAHARAAIKAMEAYAKRTGDESWILRRADENTDFESAQNFFDNVMNPTLEGPYKFMGAVADAFIEMHKEAGQPLDVIHIGGDEVAHGAFERNPTVKALMEEKGFTSEKEVHAYFVDRIRQLYDEKGLKISGWQEIALGHSPEYNKATVPSTYSINCWSTLGANKRIADELAAAGYPILLSNVERFYLDMVHTYHPDERGLNWGGSVDEFVTLAGYPSRLVSAPDANIVGIQGQVWAETIRGPQDLEYFLLPRMTAVAERAWNPDSTYSDAAYNAVVIAELPKWEAAGYTYHLRQPGIKQLEGGKFTVNTSYPDAVLRYSLDGRTPGVDAANITPGEEVSYGDAKQIRVVQWVHGRPSLVSVLNIK